MRDPDVFRQVCIADGALTWPNGADIDTQVRRDRRTPTALEGER